MKIIELKDLVKKLGGVLVMDGEEPSFVMLSYDNYRILDAIDNSGSNQVDDHLQANTIAGNEDLVNGDAADEETISRLNEEIAMLRQEIKQFEVEEILE